MARFEVVLVQSGAPEPTVSVVQTTRRYNGAVNAVKVYGDDAAENMALHTDFDAGEDIFEVLLPEPDGSIGYRAYYRYDADGNQMGWRRVYLRKKERE
jgi:hypothetical protein